MARCSSEDLPPVASLSRRLDSYWDVVNIARPWPFMRNRKRQYHRGDLVTEFILRHAKSGTRHCIATDIPLRFHDHQRPTATRQRLLWNSSVRKRSVAGMLASALFAPVPRDRDIDETYRC